MWPMCFVRLIYFHPSSEDSYNTGLGIYLILGICSASALGGTLDASRQELSYSSQETIWDGFRLDYLVEAMYAGECSKEMMDSTILYRMLE